ncbi:Branched-chain-amino-acid aminotransferase [Actinidia chinensis var. chinensis]|uniref:Branched-chain-amino-acid aminotransferase n=1 Tax=Actinidia chinensis var. chinensis TaxID=1590841 RepID=A0A2R6RKV9_ACTCC|nr:Branched-chain-amino-acid aminotransferase [Actinidia chinensis var. chinensis]
MAESENFCMVPYELADIDWDNLGFAITPTEYMYIMKCSEGQSFTKGELQRFGNIELSPAAGVLNYGQGLFEGLKAYRKHDGGILLFRPEENALRLMMGAERMCMPSPTIEQFVDAVKATVLANKKWVPPPGKGSLYIRPLLMGSGAVLNLTPAPEYTFLIYVSPVGNYFKEGIAPIHLVVETEVHRAMPGGTGGVKTIGNYASVLKAQTLAKAKGFTDILYLDCVNKKYLEEVSSSNVFVVKGNIISTPAVKGTILPGVTRKSIIDIAQSQGFQVPPPGKGSLYIRPLLMGSGAVLNLTPAPEYTFLIYVSPVGNYFKEGIAPIHLVVETEVHRAMPGGTGGVKTIGNYASVLKAQTLAKAKGFTDILYLDCVNKKYLEEVSSSNVFVVKGNIISTPAVKGTILPGVTRKSIIDIAQSQGFQVHMTSLNCCY